MNKTLVESAGAVILRCSVNKVLRKIAQNSQEKHLCWSLFLMKFQALRTTTLLKSGSSKGVFL